MLSQHLTGALLRDPCPARTEDCDAIAGLPNPPLVKLGPDDLFIRRCRLASDQVDSRYGRFRTEDLPRLLTLVQGAPVLIGHDHRTLGVARFFGGSIETRGDASWVVPRFYWPRAHSQAEDLRVMIDSGVYNEASIAFLYRTPTCSVCGRDLRSCPHWPGRTYDGRLCFFYYDGVERVTEGSLVYRGAAPGTGIELDRPPNREEGVNSAPASGPTARRLRIKHRGSVFEAALVPVTGRNRNTARPEATEPIPSSDA